MSGSTDIFEILHTTRAMRRLKPDPVPDALVRQILDAGIRAPSGGNNQTWRFLVIKDIEIKKRVQVIYKKAYDTVIGPRYSSATPPPGASKAKYDRQDGAV
ncbi:MAG: nitroreductase family protein, partial [Rhodospirillaceae bacterium]|nr:nitroreductase family protein [Rhodospirillaceae bacterium]